MNKTAHVAAVLTLASTALLTSFCGYASDAEAAKKPVTINKGKIGKPPYSWSDLGKWPDFTTGSWGTGDGNTAGLVAYDPGIFPGGFPRGGFGGGAPGAGAGGPPPGAGGFPAGGFPGGGFPGGAPGGAPAGGMPGAGAGGPPPGGGFGGAAPGAGAGVGAGGFPGSNQIPGTIVGLKNPCSGGMACKVTDLPITDAYRSSLDAKLHNAKTTSCEPLGLIADSGHKFYYTKDLIIIAGQSDFYNIWRRVYMDGRGHPEDVEPSYFGHSIGHWEGDTLVIDTVGISANARLASGLQLNSYDTHIIERIRLIKPDTLEIHKTIINTDVFKQPIEVIKQFPRLRDHEFPEAYCWSDQVETGKPL